MFNGRRAKIGIQFHCPRKKNIRIPKRLVGGPGVHFVVKIFAQKVGLESLDVSCATGKHLFAPGIVQKNVQRGGNLFGDVPLYREQFVGGRIIRLGPEVETIACAN